MSNEELQNIIALKYGYHKGDKLSEKDKSSLEKYYDAISKQFYAETDKKSEMARKIHLQNSMQEIINSNKKVGVDNAQDPQIKALAQLMYSEGMTLKQIRLAVIGMGLSGEIVDKILRRLNLGTIQPNTPYRKYPKY